MKVEGPGSSGKVASGKKIKKSGSTSGTAFSQALRGKEGAEDESASSVSGSGSVSSVDALVALQGVGDTNEDSGGNKQAWDWGVDILKDLDAIRVGLLSGGIPPERLERIADAVTRRKKTASDPALQAILRDIEVRARVELAKYRR